MLEKYELYNKVIVLIRKVNNRAMSIDIVFEEVMRVVCVYAPQNGKSIEEN